MLYVTNVAMQIKGDRVEKGTEIELSDREVENLDPRDLTLANAVREEEPEIDISSIPLAEMDRSQLQEYAKELGLSASGSKAALHDRIQLHLDSPAETDTDEEELPAE